MSVIAKSRDTRNARKALGWLLLPGLILFLNINKIIAQETTQETAQETNNKIIFNQLPVVFKNKANLKEIDQTSIIASTLYYSNAYDDPSTMPTTGTKDGVNYIAIDSLKGFPSQKEDTVYVLNQWIEIPKGKGTKQLSIKFKSKLTRDPNFQWARTKGPSKTKASKKEDLEIPKSNNTSENPSITLSIQSNPSYLTNEPQGKVITIPFNEVTKPPEWKDYAKTLTIEENPNDPQYLHIKLTTLSGYTLWLGDLEID